MTDLTTIVLTGPESSGKTTLAQALAVALGTVWVPEFARSYVEHLGHRYQPQDLSLIWNGQLAWEAWYTPRASKYLVCDTDWTVLRIWEQVLIETGQLQQQILPAGSIENRLYLLCAPDMPWAPDPVREHPNDRERLFEAYRQLLDQHGATYIILRGAQDMRLAAALSWLRKE